MAPSILGLDIGGANLKAATADKRAISVPFPLWKQPDKLPAALAELVAKFPDVEELAVTMTGELCDCFETKRDGVNAIVKAVRFASCREADSHLEYRRRIFQFRGSEKESPEGRGSKLARAGDLRRKVHTGRPCNSCGCRLHDDRCGFNP